MFDKLTISHSAYRHFCEEYAAGKYDNQRKGQALYNYFQFHKLNVDDNPLFHQLYESDGKETTELFKLIAEFY